MMSSRWLLVVFMVLASDALLAQEWENLNSPGGGVIDGMVRRPTGDLVAVQQFGGVYRSEHEAAVWSFASEALSGMAVFDVACSPAGVLHVIGFQGLAQSSDGGATWTQRRLQFIPSSIAYAANGDVLLGAPGRIMRSSNAGEDWAEIIPDPQVTYSYRMAISDAGTWIAGGYRSGLHRSTSEGADWQRVDGGLVNEDVMSVSAPRAGLLIVGVGNAAYRSVDDGVNWSRVAGLDTMNTYGVLRGGDDALYAACSAGLFVSIDGGASFARAAVVGDVTAMAPTATGMAVAAGGRVHRLFAAGTVLLPGDAGLQLPGLRKVLAVTGESSMLLAGSEDGAVYVSTDNGNNWEAIAVDVPYGYSVVDIAAPSADRVAVLTADRRIILRDDATQPWRSVATPSSTQQFQCIHARNDGTIFVGDGQGRLFVSRDWGNSWQLQSTLTIGTNAVSIIALRQDVLRSGMPLFAATDRGMLRSNNDGQSWDDITPNGLRVPFVLLAATQGASAPGRPLLAATETRLYRSTDAGANWTELLATSAGEPIRDMFMTRGGDVVSLVGDRLHTWLWNGGNPLSDYRSAPENVLAIGGVDLTGRVYASTLLRGLYRTRVGILADERMDVMPASFHLRLASTAVRAGEDIRFELSLPAAATTRCTLYDLRGREVARRELGTLIPASHRLALHTSGLPPGVYLLRVAGSVGSAEARVLLQP